MGQVKRGYDARELGWLSTGSQSGMETVGELSGCGILFRPVHSGLTAMVAIGLGGG